MTRWSATFFCFLLLSFWPGCIDDECMADGAGCKGEPVLQLPPCGDVAEPPSIETLMAALPAAGSTVGVAGPLRREAGMCTQLGCATSHGCCNSCGAGLLLSDREEPANLQPGELLLWGTIDGISLTCGGDESLLCCPVPTDGTRVLVHGRLGEYGRSIDGPLHGLEVDSICLLD